MLATLSAASTTFAMPYVRVPWTAAVFALFWTVIFSLPHATPHAMDSVLMAPVLMQLLMVRLLLPATLLTEPQMPAT